MNAFRFASIDDGGIKYIIDPVDRYAEGQRGSRSGLAGMSNRRRLL